MKKLFCLLITLIVVNFAYAEKKIGSYRLSYFDKEYDIKVSELKNGKFTVYIHTESKGSSQSTLLVESNDLENFITALQTMKDKYVEWSRVAKDNNVTEMSKEIEVKFPKTTVAWFGSKWYFSFDKKLQPRFVIMDDGTHVASIVTKFTSSSNRYIDETIYWVFSDPSDIDDLISNLDVNKILAELNKSSSDADLFK